MYNEILFDEAFWPVLIEAQESAVALLEHSRGTELHGTVAVKTVKGRRYVYLQRKHKGRYSYTYLGPADDPRTQHVVSSIKTRKRLLRTEVDRSRRLARDLRKLGVIPVVGLM